MSRSTTRAAALTGVLLLSLAFGADAARATHNEDHAEDQIEEIVDQAELDMRAVVDQFSVDAPAASTEAELDALGVAAKKQVDGIRIQANVDLWEIEAAYPVLDEEVFEARADVRQVRNEMKAAITLIADSTVPPTTTIPPTATSVPPTATTAPPTTTTTTTTTLPASTAPGDSGDDVPPPDENLDTALTPPPLFAAAQPIDTSGDSLTGTLSTGMSVVVPPAVANAVLSPFIVVEVLWSALSDGVRPLIIPGLLLAIAALVIIPRRRRNEPVDAQALV